MVLLIQCKDIDHLLWAKRKPEPSDGAVLRALGLKSARAKIEPLIYPLGNVCP